MQEWVKAPAPRLHRLRGRDTAGKGGTIKAITERVGPRIFRVAPCCADRAGEVADVHPALHAPPSRRGEVVIFDRSWYNRAGVERVMGFCTPEQSCSSSSWCRRRAGHSRSGSSCSSTGSRSAPTSRPGGSRPHRRPAQDLEALGDGPQVVQPMVRLLAGPRRHVPPPIPPGRLVRGRHERQEAGPAQHHHAFAARRCRTRRSRAGTCRCPKRQKSDGYHEPALTVRHVPTPY